MQKTVEFNYEPFHCSIFADKARILQVIINLIDNAVKFTDEGKISIRVIRNNKDIEITVEGHRLRYRKSNYAQIIF